MLNKKYYIGFLFLFSLLSVFGNSKTDSLLYILKDKPTDSTRIAIHYQLGNEFRQSDLNESLRHFNEGLSISRNLKNLKGVAEGLHGIGIYHYYTSSFDSCKYYWEQSLEIREKLKEKEGISRALNNLGVICRITGDYPCAIENYNRVIALLKKDGDRVLLSNAYNNLGLVYETTGDYKKALANFYASLRIDEEIKDDEGIAYTLNNIGLIHNHLNNHKEAKESFNTAYQLFKSLEDRIGMAMTSNNLGDAFLSIKEYQTAIEYFNKSLKLEQEIGNTNGMAFSYQSIGHVYLLKGDYKAAQEYLEKALAFQNGEDMELLVKIYLNLGVVYEAFSKPQVAYEYFLKSYTISKENQLPIPTRDALLKLYNYEHQKGNKIKAYDYLREYTRLNDSVFSKDNTRELTKMEMQFEFSKQKLQDSLEQAKKDVIIQEEFKRQEIQLKAQRQFALGLSIGFLLVLLLAVVIYRGYKAKQKANEKITQAYSIIEEKNRDITDSIEYAKYIQNAVIPDEKEVIKSFRDGFVLFMPRDIVSGDFYWYYEDDTHLMVAVSDCTGHGVPGALLAMLCSNILNTAVSERKLTNPGEILSFANRALQQSVRRKNSITQANDGMDMALCIIDRKTKNISLSTANNPLMMLHKGDITTFKGESIAIGGSSPINYVFQTIEIPYEENAVYYMLTDGYIDQFGGEKGKKYLSKRLREKLLELQGLSLTTQKEKLIENFHAWKGSYDQIDDVTLVGFKV